MIKILLKKKKKKKKQLARDGDWSVKIGCLGDWMN